MSHGKVLQIHGENKYITASLGISSYSPVFYLEASIILKDLQSSRIQRLSYFLNHCILYIKGILKANGTKAAKADPLHRDVEQTVGQEQLGEVSKMLLIWLTMGATVTCDLEITSTKFRLLKERSIASERYSVSLGCFITHSLTAKSIFTYRSTPSCSSSKTCWESVLLLKTYLHPYCYHLPP